MSFERYVTIDNKKLRCGYTTGTCAAAATKAATLTILSGEDVTEVDIMTPKGIQLTINTELIMKQPGKAEYRVKKDSGDDPDVTDKIYIHSLVQKNQKNGTTNIDGGVGVGRVSKKGLACDVGQAAINPMPRYMIREAVNEVCINYDVDDGFDVMISVPNGEEVAKRTFNSRLGIIGGISILGTSGIVEPMSEKALKDSIRVEMDVLKANGYQYLLISPGNYGKNFSKVNMNIDVENSIKCSNFIGETIDHAVNSKWKGILMIGHIGKFVKIAGGVMNTHSRYADCRIEIFAAYAALCGATQDVVKRLFDSVTTDDAISILKEHGLERDVLERLIGRIDYHLNHRTYGEVPIETIIFSNEHGILGMTDHAMEMLEKIQEDSQ